jgi:hypothetical protein
MLFPPTWAKKAPSFWAITASTKFIWGEPMKPATKRLQG